MRQGELFSAYDVLLRKTTKFAREIGYDIKVNANSVDRTKRYTVSGDGITTDHGSLKSALRRLQFAEMKHEALPKSYAESKL